MRRGGAAMLILVSGEGSTDIGENNVGVSSICPPGHWEPGPMAYFIDHFINTIIFLQ